MIDLKKIIYMIAISFPMFFACSKQNEIEAIKVKPMLQKSASYYENLRAYKASDHQVFFSWFGGTGAAGEAGVPSVYDHMPDSIDIVSLWGGYPPSNSYHAQTLQKIRKEKGTKFVWCLFGSGVDLLMEKNFPTLKKTNVFAAIDSVAKSMADTIAFHNLDGFDLDYEPGESAEVNKVFGRNDGLGKDENGPLSVQRLFKALSQYLGPKSGTGKLLIIDGYNERGVIPYIDYLVQQAYYTGSDNGLQGRYLRYGFDGELPPHKFIPAEDFEKGWKNGGVNFQDPVLGIIPSIIGFARWNPIEGAKGGIGAYHGEYEYGSTPDYKYIRQAIQIMNPARR